MSCSRNSPVFRETTVWKQPVFRGKRFRCALESFSGCASPFGKAFWQCPCDLLMLFCGDVRGLLVVTCWSPGRLLRSGLLVLVVVQSSSWVVSWRKCWKNTEGFGTSSMLLVSFVCAPTLSGLQVPTNSTLRQRQHQHPPEIDPVHSHRQDDHEQSSSESSLIPVCKPSCIQSANLQTCNKHP